MRNTDSTSTSQSGVNTWDANESAMKVHVTDLCFTYTHFIVGQMDSTHGAQQAKLFTKPVSHPLKHTLAGQ